MADHPGVVTPVALPDQRDEGAPPTLSDVAITATVVAGLLDAVPDGIVMIDASGAMLLVNTQLEEMFGYPRWRLLGHSVEMLLPESVRGAHAQHRAQFAAQPRVRPMGLGLALRGLRSDGSVFPVEISLSPLATGDGQWAVATVRDATSREEVEARRRDDAVSAEQGRIAEDLADTVIGGLFGTGLQLQGLVELADGRVRQGLLDAVDNIDATIRAIRRTIFDLDPPAND